MTNEQEKYLKAKNELTVQQKEQFAKEVFGWCAIQRILSII